MGCLVEMGAQDGCCRTVLFWVVVSLPAIFWLLCYFAAGLIPSETRPIIAVYALPRVDKLLVGGLPHRWFRNFAVFDLCAALPYMAHISVPIVFIVWLLLQRSCTDRVARFVWSFGWMNVLALATQIALPTAPPWFYDDYINDQHPQMPSYRQRGFPAGLLRVDDLLGTNLFRNAYSQSPVVYGAFPSMHCGWPFHVALHYTQHPAGHRWFWVHGYSLLLTWAAMYLRHHYLTDVLGGYAYAYITTHLAQWTFSSDLEKCKKTPQLSPSASPGISGRAGHHRRPHSADFGRTGFVGSSLTVSPPSALALPKTAPVKSKKSPKAEDSYDDTHMERLSSSVSISRSLSKSEGCGIMHSRRDSDELSDIV